MMNVLAKLEEVNKKLNLAAWYTAMSVGQEKLCVRMHNILRDDYEQGTGHNMYQALLTLGLKPVISKDKISRMVQLSRNNVLAFLFFVLEGYYKTCHKDGVFSVNEKLLMIAIAKIDFLPTVRALNAILPEARPSHLDMKRLEAEKRKSEAPKLKSISSAESQPPKFQMRKQKSPYFMSQPKPVQRISKLSTTLPDFVVGFKFWPINGPPNYGKEEDSPWFAEYHLNPGQRLIKQTIDETLERYFKLGQVEKKSHDEATEGEKSSEGNLCLVHRGLVVESQILRDELAVKARDRCLELIDVREPYAKLRRKRILDQLEHDIDIIMERHRRAMRCDQTKVMTIDNLNCILCQQILVSQPWPEPGVKVGRALVGDDLDMAHTAATDTYRGRRLEGGGCGDVDKVHTEATDTYRGSRLEGGGCGDVEKVHTAAMDTYRGIRLAGGGCGGGKKKDPKKGKGKDKDKKKKKKKEEPPPPEPEKKKRPVKKEPQWKPPPRKLVSGTFRMADIDFTKKSERCQAPRQVSECSLPPAPKKTAISFFLAPGKIDAKGRECEMRFSSKRTKKKFFRGTRSNKPYIFKYQRVFQSGQPKPFDLDRILCTSFVKALDKSDSDGSGECGYDCLVSEINIEHEIPPEYDADEAEEEANDQADAENQRLPDLFDPFAPEMTSDSRSTLDRSSEHSQRSHVDHKAEIVEAVVRCAKAIFKKQEMIKRAEMERQERLTPRKALIYKPGEKFDPDNAEQMDKLLKDGLHQLSKDQRYVLASLPDSHKIPQMREWIKRRFGKVYTQKELDASLDEAKKIFEMVTLVQDKTPDPDLMGMDKLKRDQENFNYYKGLKKLANKIKLTYFDVLNSNYMASLNPAWYAMGNYLVPGGPPRQTFFSYMASNPQEIMRAKVWSGQYRDYRQLRYNRTEAARKGK
ncbi:uncharacterized protein Dana_GF11566 [Drosophila ananassae]|uniref:Uncharacterized protein n=1 Tax=Drosophila ananassae TaxID=7217 RepID=B3MBL7_DROAN|nr:uncharacterized protein LOC6494430 [Drosophila ananassae]EDV37148.2 uncharacterized protein Dana_GF11566 [Drosophila ananassae]